MRQMGYFDDFLLLSGLLLILIDGKFVFNRIDKKPYGSDQPKELRVASCAYQCMAYTYTESFCYGFYFGDPVEGDKPFLAGDLICSIRLQPTPPEVEQFYQLNVFQEKDCSMCSHNPSPEDTVKDASEGFNTVRRGHLDGKFYAVHTEVNVQGVSNAAEISSVDCRVIYCPRLGMHTVQVFSEEENKFLQDMVNAASNGPAQFWLGGGYSNSNKRVEWWYPGPDYVRNTNFMPWKTKAPTGPNAGCIFGVEYKWSPATCLCLDKKNAGCVNTTAACVCEIDAKTLL